MIGRLIGDKPIQPLARIVFVTILINVFVLVSDLFTEIYTSSPDANSAKYLFFGLARYNAFVPRIWTVLLFNVLAAVLFLTPAAMHNTTFVLIACPPAFAVSWIQRGWGRLCRDPCPAPCTNSSRTSPASPNGRLLREYGCLV